MTNSPQPPNDENSSPLPATNPGYVLGQLAQALTTSKEDNDPAIRERARQKIDRWLQVMQGIFRGSLAIGSRTPVAETPAWATLEVMQGGFATGNLLAGGTLQAHEQAFLAALPPVPTGQERAALNQFFLSDAGLLQLHKWLHTGNYRIAVPEEGALLIVAWLVEQGRIDEAQQLLEQLGSFLGSLRFYPIPAEQPISLDAAVAYQPVGAIRNTLAAIQVPEQIQAEREAILVWAPLYDRVIALFCETVEGSLPYVPTAADGTPARQANGHYQLAGGWPCQHYPKSWRERAQAWLAEYHTLHSQHQTCRKLHTVRYFAALRGSLEQCVADPRLLTGREVGLVRAALAAFALRRGVPGSEQLLRLRTRQTQQVQSPSIYEMAQLMFQRLQAFPADGGVTDLHELSLPVHQHEAVHSGVPTGREFPPSILKKLERCFETSLAYLVQHQVIPSSEAIATVVPELSALVQSAGLADIRLQRLYQGLYTAFRRRRSLLLFNLQHQVKFVELPWVQFLEAERTTDSVLQQRARDLLTEVIELALTTYPHQILPNRLLREVRALAQTAGLHLPVVDELAADIFMGEFSEKYLRAAQQAGNLLAGSLYERYYKLDYQTIKAIDDVTASSYGTPTSAAFAALCRERAGATTPAPRWSPAYNGTIIEQQQIMTTHNLAPLCIALGLSKQLAPELGTMAHRCFIWICRTLQHTTQWHVMLRNMKNSAYAWRQMVFYLSLLPVAEQQKSLIWVKAYLSYQQPAFQQRFQPVVDDLGRMINGIECTEQRTPFLGWATGRHWLMSAAPEQSGNTEKHTP